MNNPHELNIQLEELYMHAPVNTDSLTSASNVEELTDDDVKILLRDTLAFGRRSSAGNEYRNLWVSRLDNLLQAADSTTTPSFRIEIRELFINTYDLGRDERNDQSILDLFRGTGIYRMDTAKNIERGKYEGSLAEFKDLSKLQLEEDQEQIEYLRALLPQWRIEFKALHGEDLPE